MRRIVRTAAVVTLLASALPAYADVLSFTGSVTGVSTFVGVDPSCNPLTFRSMIDPSSTVGTSPFGDFTYSTSTCLSPGGALSRGTFIIDFGVDQFSGTFDGGSTPTATPGIAATSWLFTVLSGTGRFAGASGTFDGDGLTDARTQPAQVSIDFAGSIDAPAVPEPASWALMILGFGSMGFLARRGRRRLIAQFA